jgi:hypothetical protein
MQTLKYTDEDDAGFGSPDYAPRTFKQGRQEQLDKEIAEGRKFPCFFASTEY